LTITQINRSTNIQFEVWYINEKIKEMKQFKKT